MLLLIYKLDMHKKFIPLFEKANTKLDEYRESIANQCFEDNKDNVSEFIECLKQKQDVVTEIPDKIEAFKKFGLFKSSICSNNWENSRQCIKEAREKLNEAIGGFIVADEE